MKPENSKQQALFEAWYAADRDMPKAAASCQIPERTGRDWAERFHWHARAAARDQEAAKRAERAAIQRRVKMLERQRLAGELLQERGTQHFRDNKIETAADAMRAIKIGIDVQRQAEGLPAALVEILNYSEDELRAERERIIRRAAVDLDRPAALASGEPEPDE